jgi:hypothetical protein
MIALVTQGCVATPELEQDCPALFTEEKEINKCKKRVVSREKRRFELEQEDKRKKVCNLGGGVWISDSRNGGCVSRGELQEILGGRRSF